jgi:hypothetical protein
MAVTGTMTGKPHLARLSSHFQLPAAEEAGRIALFF